MGLAFSHGEASWSYGGFSDFRNRLVKQINPELHVIDEKISHYDTWLALWNDTLASASVCYGDYDPIYLLLGHSDCDGILQPWACRVLAARIRELVKDWDDWDKENPKDNIDEAYDKMMALKLCDGMDMAASSEENLKFI